MSYEELTTNQDSILNFLAVNDIYHIILNHAVYQLIEKKEYQKAVAVAQLLNIYEPHRINEIDTLGEAYFNNGQIDMAKHYDQILKKLEPEDEGLGLAIWETNKKERLQKDVL